MSEKPTVVITGGLGFIGAQVSRTFADSGYDVIIIDTNTSRKWSLPEGATLFPHEYQATTTAGILEMFKPETVVHLAASHGCGQPDGTRSRAAASALNRCFPQPGRDAPLHQRRRSWRRRRP